MIIGALNQWKSVHHISNVQYVLYYHWRPTHFITIYFYNACKNKNVNVIKKENLNKKNVKTKIPW